MKLIVLSKILYNLKKIYCNNNELFGARLLISGYFHLISKNICNRWVKEILDYLLRYLISNKFLQIKKLFE